jgi:hypothetical protein
MKEGFESYLPYEKRFRELCGIGKVTLGVLCDMKGGFESCVRYERRFLRVLCDMKGRFESFVRYERRV